MLVVTCIAVVTAYRLTVSLFLHVNRFVEWEDFADHAMVHNPKGGTAVLPKMITEKAKMDNTMMNKTKKPIGMAGQQKK